MWPVRVPGAICPAPWGLTLALSCYVTVAGYPGNGATRGARAEARPRREKGVCSAWEAFSGPEPRLTALSQGLSPPSSSRERGWLPGAPFLPPTPGCLRMRACGVCPLTSSGLTGSHGAGGGGAARGGCRSPALRVPRPHPLGTHTPAGKAETAETSPTRPLPQPRAPQSEGRVTRTRR